MRTPFLSIRTSHRILSALSVLGLLTAGCTNQSDGPGDGGAADAALTLAQRGAAVVKNLGCAACHNPEDTSTGVLAGKLTPLGASMTYAANLTPDKDTGLGSWSDADLIKAIRSGLDDEGHELCLSMPRFSNLSDSDAQDLVAYLRSIKAVNRAIPESSCPPIKPRPTDGGTADAH